MNFNNLIVKMILIIFTITNIATNFSMELYEPLTLREACLQFIRTKDPYDPKNESIKKPLLAMNNKIIDILAFFQHDRLDLLNNLPSSVITNQPDKFIAILAICINKAPALKPDEFIKILFRRLPKGCIKSPIADLVFNENVHKITRAALINKLENEYYTAHKDKLLARFNDKKCSKLIKYSIAHNIPIEWLVTNYMENQMTLDEYLLLDNIQKKNVLTAEEIAIFDKLAKDDTESKLLKKINKKIGDAIRKPLLDYIITYLPL